MNRDEVAAIVAEGRKTRGEKDRENMDDAMTDFADWRDGAGGVERQYLVETLALARPGAEGSLKQLLNENLAVREEVIVRNTLVAAAGPKWSLPQNQNFWFGHRPGALPTQQPAQHVTRIHGIEVEVDSAGQLQDYNYLRRFVNFVLHYGDKRPDFIIPMSKVMIVNTVENATDAASVGAKQPFTEPYVLPTRENLVILPNEQVENWSMQVVPGAIPSTLPSVATLEVTVRALASVFQPLNRR